GAGSGVSRKFRLASYSSRVALRVAMWPPLFQPPGLEATRVPVAVWMVSAPDPGRQIATSPHAPSGNLTPVAGDARPGASLTGLRGLAIVDPCAGVRITRSSRIGTRRTWPIARTGGC